MSLSIYLSDLTTEHWLVFVKTTWVKMFPKSQIFYSIWTIIISKPKYYQVWQVRKHIYLMASNRLSSPVLLGVHRVLCSHWGILLLKALFLIDKIQLNANEVLEYLPVEGNCVLSDSSPGVIPRLLSWVVERSWQQCPLKWDKLKLTQPRSCARNATGETIGGSFRAGDHPLKCGNIDRYLSSKCFCFGV